MAHRPNILMIVVDQHRADCTGAAGNTRIHTPNLDRLAREGAACLQAYTTLPACCPARQAMITGVKEEKLGAYWNYDLAFYTDSLKPETPTWPRLLQQAGYQTAFIGKWHTSKTHSPLDFGFDQYNNGHTYNDQFEGPHAISRPHYEHGYLGEPDPLPLENSRTHLYAHEAIDTIAALAKEESPWLVRLDFNEPHLPCRPSAPFSSMYNPKDILPWGNFNEDFSDKPFIQSQQLRNWGLEDFSWETWSRTVALYYGMISQIDDAVGRVIASLEEQGILDDTLIIYTSDHGDLCGAHRMIDKHYVLYDDVLRVPLFMRWPAGIQAGTRIDAFCSHTLDIPATIMDLLNFERPDWFMGNSLKPWLRGDSAENWPQHVSATFNGAQFGLYCMRMLRTKEWKFIWNPTAEDELYHLTTDPYELVNLAEKEGLESVKSDLKAQLKAQLIVWDDPLAKHVFFSDSDIPLIGR
jgi:arylsulfatase A-like enzyme